jgi:P pilus assembly chaperone PapD
VSFFLRTLLITKESTLKAFKILSLLLLFITITYSTQSFAYGLSPMSLTIESKGKGAVGSFTLENKGDDPVPVELSVTHRTIDLNGKESATPLTDDERKDFTIYPPMLTVGPHETRIIKVRYKGKPNLTIELNYRLFVTELPLNNYLKDKGKNDLKFLMRYGASLYISDAKFSDDISISDVSSVDLTDYKKKTTTYLSVTFQNKGLTHRNLINYNVTLTDSVGRSVTIPWVQVAKSFGTINVLSKQKRHVLVPWVKELTKGKLSGEIKFIE